MLVLVLVPVLVVRPALTETRHRSRTQHKTHAYVKHAVTQDMRVSCVRTYYARTSSDRAPLATLRGAGRVRG